MEMIGSHTITTGLLVSVSRDYTYVLRGMDEYSCSAIYQPAVCAVPKIIDGNRISIQIKWYLIRLPSGILNCSPRTLLER